MCGGGCGAGSAAPRNQAGCDPVCAERGVSAEGAVAGCGEEERGDAVDVAGGCCCPGYDGAGSSVDATEHVEEPGVSRSSGFARVGHGEHESIRCGVVRQAYGEAVVSGA